MKKILLVAGARPNFMKIAPLIRAIQAHNKAAASADDSMSKFVTPAKAGVQVSGYAAGAETKSKTLDSRFCGNDMGHMGSRVRGNDGGERGNDTLRQAQDDNAASAIQPVLVHTGQHYD